MRALRYAIDEAVSSLWRGRHSAALAMANITIAVCMLGGFLIITLNLERLSAEWSQAAGMSVYLDDNIAPADRQAIERLLAPGDVVAGAEFVSKDEALVRFKETFADLAGTADSFESNPLPASYEVRLRTALGLRQETEALGARLQQTPGVTDVRYDRQWLDRLTSAIAVVRGIGLVLSAVLTIAAALTVANVVRLALYARRDELAIMQLVGAPAVYMRGPFVMEGVLQGGIGALVALALLSGAYLAARGLVLTPLAAAVHLSSIRFLTVKVCALLLAGGMAVGCLGGLAAAGWRGSFQTTMDS